MLIEVPVKVWNTLVSKIHWFYHFRLQRYNSALFYFNKIYPKDFRPIKKYMLEILLARCNCLVKLGEVSKKCLNSLHFYINRLIINDHKCLYNIKPCSQNLTIIDDKLYEVKIGWFR